jgi:rSAM/selenodomain-associated transferase 1
VTGAALIVLAKAPRPGASKTRLCPPCTPVQAAALARAALVDTLDAVLATPAARRVLVLEGPADDWVPSGVEVIAQRGGGLDVRLAHAFADVGDPALLVGMDTPQATPADLADGLARLMAGDADAVLGPAHDGGYWAIGLREPDARAFVGVPMSTAHTGRSQLARLRSLSLRVALLPALRDVDRIADAHAVAALAPSGRFARMLATTAAA